MLADSTENLNLVINGVTAVLLALIAGWFQHKAKVLEQAQKEQGVQITETKHIVNSKNDALTSKVDTLTETVRVLTGDNATMVEQARDKSGDVLKPVIVKVVPELGS